MFIIKNHVRVNSLIFMRINWPFYLSGWRMRLESRTFTDLCIANVHFCTVFQELPNRWQISTLFCWFHCVKMMTLNKKKKNRKKIEGKTHLGRIVSLVMSLMTMRKSNYHFLLKNYRNIWATFPIKSKASYSLIFSRFTGWTRKSMFRYKRNMRCSWKQFVRAIVSRTLSKFQFYLARSAKDLGRGAWRWGDGNGGVS